MSRGSMNLLSNLLRGQSNCSKRSAPSWQSTRHRLHFEALETRDMLAATLFVDPSVAPSGSIFAKINDAIAAAHLGDTIKVVGGTYTENVVVDKTLTLVGGQVRVPGQSGASIVTPATPGG